VTSASVKSWLRSSLLERLTDLAPERRRESRETQEVDTAELRRLLRRDLSWLLNTTHVAATVELSEFPEVARSVLNYGIPDLTGRTLSSVDQVELARHVAHALVYYESRLVRGTLDVRVLTAPHGSGKSTLWIEIAAELRAEPLPLALRLRAEVDLESGSVAVLDDRAQEEP
jgi:type VI secretion system protein ImpF